MGQRHHGGVVRLQGHGLDAHLHGAGAHRLLHQHQRMVLEERIVVGGQLRVVRQLGRRGDVQGGADVAVIGQPQPVHLPRHVGAVLPDGAVAGVAHGLGAAGGGGGGVRLGGGIGRIVLCTASRCHDAQGRSQRQRQQSFAFHGFCLLSQGAGHFCSLSSGSRSGWASSGDFSSGVCGSSGDGTGSDTMWMCLAGASMTSGEEGRNRGCFSSRVAP